MNIDSLFGLLESFVLKPALHRAQSVLLTRGVEDALGAVHLDLLHLVMRVGITDCINQVLNLVQKPRNAASGIDGCECG
jgi:hypothetical protein